MSPPSDAGARASDVICDRCGALPGTIVNGGVRIAYCHRCMHECTFTRGECAGARAESDRWGVWCEPPYYQGCGRSASPQWAAGPDGELVLYETVAKNLADHWNEIIGGGWIHTARRLSDGPPPAHYPEWDNA